MKNVKLCAHTLGIVIFLATNVFTIPFLYILHGLMI